MLSLLRVGSLVRKEPTVKMITFSGRMAQLGTASKRPISL